MGIRETLNNNPKATGVIVAVVVLAMGWVVYDNFLRSSGPQLNQGSEAFYTEDDGQTYFAGPFTNLGKDFKGPNGKEAVRAMVFQYSGGKPFVAWMEKYTPAGKQILADFYNDPANAQKPPPPHAMPELLLKKPGGQKWVSVNDPSAAIDIRRVPPKGNDHATPVMP